MNVLRWNVISGVKNPVFSADSEVGIEMVRKIFKTGNSLVVSLPKESIATIGLQEGSPVNVAIDTDQKRILIEPVEALPNEIDSAFAQQLGEFIEQYRPALEALAK